MLGTVLDARDNTVNKIDTPTANLPALMEFTFYLI